MRLGLTWFKREPSLSPCPAGLSKSRSVCLGSPTSPLRGVDWTRETRSVWVALPDAIDTEKHGASGMIGPRGTVSVHKKTTGDSPGGLIWVKESPLSGSNRSGLGGVGAAAADNHRSDQSKTTGSDGIGRRLGDGSDLRLADCLKFD